MNTRSQLPLVGTLAPDLTLSTATGLQRSLFSFWSLRPTIFCFVRHVGCPLLNALLVDLLNHRSDFDKAGVQVALVLPLDVRAAAHFAVPRRLPFPLLADGGRRAFKAFGLAAPTTSYSPIFERQLRRRYGARIPAPSPSFNEGGVFAVSTDGVVRYAFSSPTIEPYPLVEYYLAAFATDINQVGVSERVLVPALQG